MRILMVLTCILPTFLSGQYYLLGTAGYMENGCIQLTPDAPFAEGLAYNQDKLDLTRYFEIQFDIYLGDKEEGADGITFVMHNDVRGFGAFGQWGECMGYGRFNPAAPGNSIDPSIAVEFDTYQNLYQLDPESDHVAYLENGSSRHQRFWNNADSLFNLEDDYLHEFRLRWNPKKQELIVFLDNWVVYKGEKDLLQEIFEGESKVIWGFTASTGRKYNQQYFCLKRIVEMLPRLKNERSG